MVVVPVPVLVIVAVTEMAGPAEIEKRRLAGGRRRGSRLPCFGRRRCFYRRLWPFCFCAVPYCVVILFALFLSYFRVVLLNAVF